MEKESFLTREKLLGDQQFIKSPLKFIVFLFIVLTFLDLIYLNYKILTQPNEQKLQTSIGATKGSAPSESASLTEALDICPQSCVAQINQAVSSSNIKKTETIVQAESLAREFFIPLG